MMVRIERLGVGIALALAIAACQFGERQEDTEAPDAADGPMALANDTARADSIDWGDDEGDWANDGECDDKRFAGDGMTDTLLLDEDIGHDATDCRTAYEAGQLTLRSEVGNRPGAAARTPQQLAANTIDWGDDEGDWANDGECDDKRFAGPGMTTTPLLDADIRHDATDCREQYERGRLRVK